MKFMTTSHLILIGTLFLVTVTAIFAIRSLKYKLKRAERTIEWYNNKFLRKQGYTSLWKGSDSLNYNLQSFDGGKTWYAIDQNASIERDAVVILGEAESVYPGLMKSLDAWDKLIKHVEENGPIGQDGISEEEKKLMEDADLKLVPK